MKLNLANTGQQNVVTMHGDGYVEINARRHEHSVMLGTAVIEPWPVANIRELTPADLEAAALHAPEVLIIGTGRHFTFPPPQALRPLVAARIGHEVMDTPAACRTYNVLLGEGRKVMAVLIVD
jgi:uncharacterized protein